MLRFEVRPVILRTRNTEGGPLLVRFEVRLRCCCINHTAKMIHVGRSTEKNLETLPEDVSFQSKS